VGFAKTWDLAPAGTPVRSSKVRGSTQLVILFANKLVALQLLRFSEWRTVQWQTQCLLRDNE
jgi:hypothetical protein